MFRSYLQLAFRNLIKSPITSTINIVGLAIGMLCALLILVFVQKETSFDAFHEKSDRLYRVLTIDEALGVSSNLVGITIPALAPAMESELAVVSNSVRMRYNGRSLIDYNRKPVYAERSLFTEPSIFELFDFPLAAGNVETALFAPNTVVLTEAFAEKLFGTEEPMGKRIRMDNDQELEVVGVLQDVKEASHMEFDVLVSMATAEVDSGFYRMMQSWGSISITTYVELAEGASELEVEAAMETIIRKNEVGDNFSVTLQPFAEIHLQSNDILFDQFNFEKTEAGYIYTLSLVGLFVILIAAFNFMNLSTARASNRAKEVGMRKVLGALRPQLVLQFLAESTLLCLLSFVLALALLGITGIFMNFGLEGNLLPWLLGRADLMVPVVLSVLGLGLLAGIYPAFVLSGFRIIAVLKGNFKTGTAGIWLRRSLVMIQFAASVALIIGAMVVYQQMNFLKNVDKGFDEEQVLTLDLGDETLQEQAEELEAAMANMPGVQQTALSSSMPGRGTGRRGILPEGHDEEEVWIVSVLGVNEDFFPLMGIDMVSGRNYSEEFTTDADEHIILNEAAAAAIGWEDAIGKKIRYGGGDRTVIGVVEDFHFANLRHKIEPMIMVYNAGRGNVLSAKVRQENVSGTLETLAGHWKTINPNHPFEYRFFDEEFGQQFESDERFASLVLGFTWLAVLIACMGLLGLSIFTAEQRTKEIGIRKVLGAGSGQLFVLLSKAFFKPVLIGCLLAVPIAWYFLDQWLNGFAYRIDMPWLTFAIACIVALVVTQLTVSWHSLKAANGNPVDALKWE